MEKQKNEEQTQSSQEPVATEVTTTETSKSVSSDDVEKNKTMAIVGYIFPILFFIPLLSDETKNSPFAKFHANQQLVLLISIVVVNVVGGMIPVLGWFIILPIGDLILFILAIMGIINAVNGEMKKLAMIGGIDILK